MNKIIAPRGYRILRAKEIIRSDDFYYQPGIEKVWTEAGKTADHIAYKYGHTSCYIRKIKKQAKPKKLRPKKSLAQIYADAKWDGKAWKRYSEEQSHYLALQAVAREVRRRINNDRKASF